jgi:hypothetical protein
MGARGGTLAAITLLALGAPPGGPAAQQTPVFRDRTAFAWPRQTRSDARGAPISSWTRA